MNRPVTVAGFFSGTGGIELGLKQTGKFKILYANDQDKWASQTYALNFNEKYYQLEDINNVDFKVDVPEIDLVAGGFPCQAFSIAGYRKGFDDNKGRGNLFFRLMDVIVAREPEILFLENVKNLVSHDKGNTFKVILNTLHNLGYYTKWQILNAKDYGNIPQGRERIYIVSFKDKETAERFKFPEPIKLTTRVQDLVDFKNKVDDKYYYTQTKYPAMWPIISADINEKYAVYQWRRHYVRKNKSNVAPTLTANMGTGGHNVPLIFTKYGIRKLTPRECFNLMGYPEDYRLPEQADAHLYKQAGNAVVVPVIKRIGDEIWNSLDTK